MDCTFCSTFSKSRLFSLLPSLCRHNHELCLYSLPHEQINSSFGDFCKNTISLNILLCLAVDKCLRYSLYLTLYTVTINTIITS